MSKPAPSNNGHSIGDPVKFMPDNLEAYLFSNLAGNIIHETQKEVAKQNQMNYEGNGLQSTIRHRQGEGMNGTNGINGESKASSRSAEPPATDSYEPPVLDYTTPLNCVKAFFFSVCIFSSAFLGSVYVLFPISPLLFLAPRIYRQIVDFLIGHWLVLPSALIEHLWKVEFTVSGERIDWRRASLVIMNHRTRTDWLFYWNALFRMDRRLLTRCKISLKGILKYVPGAGWAMASNAFLFLDRVFASDQRRIDSLIEYYARDGVPYQLLLFPEGTDKCEYATERSRRFAEKEHLTHYKYVLHPRTTGFVHLLRRMRAANYLDCLYDVSIAFGDPYIVQGEFDLAVLGMCPRRVHFHVERVELDELPAIADMGNADSAPCSEEEEEQQGKELAEWLKKKWVRKEAMLEEFYRSGRSFTAGDKPKTTGSPQITISDAGKANGGSGIANHIQTYEMSRPLQLQQQLIAGVWLGMTVLWAYVFFTYQYQWWLAFAATSFFIGCQWQCGGLEMLAARPPRHV